MYLLNSGRKDNERRVVYKLPASSEADLNKLIKRNPKLVPTDGKEHDCSVCQETFQETSLPRDEIKTHPLLKVTICKQCYVQYEENMKTLARGEDGKDDQCSWCGEDGSFVVYCSCCPRVYCKDCVNFNLNPDIWNKIVENDEWKCFVCDDSSLKKQRVKHLFLVNLLHQVYPGEFNVIALEQIVIRSTRVNQQTPEEIENVDPVVGNQDERKTAVAPIAVVSPTISPVIKSPLSQQNQIAFVSPSICALSPIYSSNLPNRNLLTINEQQAFARLVSLPSASSTPSTSRGARRPTFVAPSSKQRRQCSIPRKITQNHLSFALENLQTPQMIPDGPQPPTISPSILKSSHSHSYKANKTVSFSDNLFSVKSFRKKEVSNQLYDVDPRETDVDAELQQPKEIEPGVAAAMFEDPVEMEIDCVEIVIDLSSDDERMN